MNGYPSFYPRIALVAPSPGQLRKEYVYVERYMYGINNDIRI